MSEGCEKQRVMVKMAHWKNWKLRLSRSAKTSWRKFCYLGYNFNIPNRSRDLKNCNSAGKGFHIPLTFKKEELIPIFPYLIATCTLNSKCGYSELFKFNKILEILHSVNSWTHFANYFYCLCLTILHFLNLKKMKQQDLFEVKIELYYTI